MVLIIGVIAVFGTAQSVQDGNGNGTRALDWLGWGLLLAATLSLAIRRRHPAIVLVVTSAAIAVSVMLGYPTGPIWGLPLFALYTAAATGRRALALLGAAALGAVLLGWVLLASNPGTLAEIGFSVLLVALSVAVGEVARGRRDYLAEAERRAIRGASRQAMAELKATVTALRDGAAPRDPLPGLQQVDELVGMAVRVVARGDALLSPGVTRRLIAEFAARPARRPPAAVRLDVLTDREREVLALIGEGLANDDIAERLFMAPATVKTHVSRIMSKLGVHDRAQLVVLACETGLVHPGWL